MLEVHTTAVERILWLSWQRFEFGQLAVGRAKTLPLRLRNLSEDDTTLFVKNVAGLNAVGPFSVRNALRPLPPKSPPPTFECSSHRLTKACGQRCSNCSASSWDGL